MKSKCFPIGSLAPGVTLFACLALSGREAWAVAKPQLPPEVRAAGAVAEGSGDDGKIATFVKAQVAAMATPANLVAARTALVVEVEANPAPSVAFLDAYARNLDAVASTTLPAASVATRINLAMTIARVADKAGNARLAGSVTKLVQDQTEPVAYWGLRAARGVTYYVLTVPGASAKTPLLQAIVTSAKKYDSGRTVQAAYNALAIKKPDNAPASWSTAVNLAAGAMQDLMQSRLDLYAKSIPNEAAVEKVPCNYLVDRATVWAEQNAVAQTRTLNLLTDLIGLAGQRRAPEAMSNSGLDLTFVINQAANSVWVIGQYNDNAALQGVMVPLQKLTTLQRAAADAVGAMAAGIFPAVQAAVPTMKLHAPPTVQPLATPTPDAPATTPS